MNRTGKGNYHRLRTKHWLELHGYYVENLEHSQRILTREGKVIFIRRDIWGADLIARNADRIVFIQCKANEGDIAKGIRELSEGPWPEGVDRWVCHWPARRREAEGPEIVEVGKETSG